MSVLAPPACSAARFQRRLSKPWPQMAFNTTALCSPTRAALLTGRDQHTVHTGIIMERSLGYPGYDSLMPKSAGTVAEILRGNGYNTAWFGKNHNVPAWQSSAAGPF